MTLSNFQREKREWCGEYQLVSIYPRSKNQDNYAKGKRPKTKNISRPAQRNLNDKNSLKHFKLQANGNFKEGDFLLRLSYSTSNLPKSPEEAKKNISNYIERLRYELKKVGRDKELKWMCVTEFEETNKKGKPTRIHHHLLINNVIDRDLLESKWSKRVKGKKKPQPIGFTDSKRIQLTEDAGLDNLIGYLFKFKKENRTWSASTNLEKPKQKVVDHKYRRRKMEKLRNSNDLGQEYFEKMYPNYFVKDIKWSEIKYRDESGKRTIFIGLRCELKLIRKEQTKRW